MLKRTLSSRWFILTPKSYFFAEIKEKLPAQLAHNIGPPTARQRYAISMAYCWWAVDGHEVVASTVNQGLEAPVDHKTEHVQTLLKKYDRPSNCTFLEVPKVNKSVWVSKHTSKGIKESDRIMQRTQTYLTKGLIPLVKIMDKTLQSDSGESEELFDLAMDSFNLLAFSHRDLSSQRRRLLAPAIANKYKQLCSETAPISPLHLFGEEES